MSKFSDFAISNLKQSIPLLLHVQNDGIELKRVGANWVGKCPFHTEKTGSLVITPSKNLFHCFGCSAAGSVIDWVMRRQNIAFREALDYLNQRYGGNWVDNNETINFASMSDAELMKWAILHYKQTLKKERLGLNYLNKRGLEDVDLIEEFSLGYIDRSLAHHLPSNRSSAGEQVRNRLQDLGLLRASNHEHFRDCVVVPIYTETGEVGEVYGRKISPNIKPEFPKHLYLKGKHRGIFNLQSLNGKKVLLLCEAIIDALTLYRIGFKAVTSSFGVEGFTDEMFNFFKAISIEVVFIIYDGDEAGERGSRKVAQRLIQSGINCFQVLLPQEQDVNSYAMEVAGKDLPNHLAEVKESFVELIKNSVWMGDLEAPTSLLEHSLSHVLELEGKELPSLAENTTKTYPSEPVKSKEEAAKNNVYTSTSNDNPKLNNSVNEIKSSQKTSQLEVEIKGDKEPEIYTRIDQREYRVRGLHKNLSVGHMAINLRLSVGSNQDNLHIDNVELCSSKQRFRFAKDAELATGIKEKLILSDMAKLLNKLEEIQQEHILSTLKPKKKEVEISESDREEAIKFLKSPNLIERIQQDFEACGLVGESTNAIVGYLSAISRKLAEPLAIIVQSSSAAGKTALMEAVSRFVPEEEREQFSAMTGRSLFYIGEKDLKNKNLFISEQEGAKDASYAIKLLQSEGKLRIASTGKDPISGKLVTHEYLVEVPVMIFLTTTQIEIDEELINRCIVLYVNEDREQTRAIHRQQRLKETLEGLWQTNSKDKIISLHQNAQRILRPLWVVNPYAESLTFVDARTRTRRDHTKYLSLIKSIALLHQYQKPIRESTRGGITKQYIEVSLSDISLANRLADEVLGRSLDELPPHTRNFLEKLYLMVQDLAIKEEKQASGVRFTAKQAREHSGLSYEQTRFHLERLEKLEYVLIQRASQGNRYFYELMYDGRGKDGHKFMVGLLNPDQLNSNSVINSLGVEGNTTYIEEESTNCKVSNRAETGQLQATYRTASTIDT